MRRWLGALALLGGLLLASCTIDGTSDDSTTTGGPGGSSPDSADRDGDTISDADEGASEGRNTDGDDFPDARDKDSDQDGLSDADEAGDTDPATPPVDTDGDGMPDYVDTDSDGDGISDTDELDSEFDPVDTDDDGTPDHLDLDSDGDTILDRDELTSDADRDGVGNVRDLDSDGDGIPDAIEAGDDAIDTKPIDTDSDGLPDFLDLDSDGDFLLDSVEDANGNGLLDPGESSPTKADTDGDGTPDLVETIAGSDPNDATENIPEGDFYFVLPYLGNPDNGPLDFTTSVKQADVFVSMDTTGSFGEEIEALQVSLQNVVVPGIQSVIADAAFGVGRFEDFPLEPFGCAGDRPFELLQSMTTDLASVSAAIDALPPAACGLDTPESGYEALYRWATGMGLSDFGIAPSDVPGIGGVGFRADALPIILQIGDAVSHGADDYAAITSQAHGRDEVVAALNAIGARVIGIDSLENVGTPNDPRAQLEDLAIATKAVIPPDATTGKCKTGVGGAERDPVDINGSPACPVVFDVLADGTGLGELIVNAVAQLATLGVLDISTKVGGETVGPTGDVVTTGFTTADFIQSVTPIPPVPTGASIDGDVFRNVQPGNTVNFEVTGFNDFQPATNVDQLFSADIDVLGDLVTVLDVRKVYIIVPRIAEVEPR